MIFDAPNRNRFWADLLVEELVRHGVTTFFLSPGSRSSPLTAAVAAHPRTRPILHFDERASAFAALGYARATGGVAAWITTSGTAVANGFPAVVEAGTDGVPMLLLTADRPPELRETGANQTIDQVKLFGGYTRWQFDVPPPDPAIDPAMILTTVDQAVYRACRHPRGPVHLNLMFREPLAPAPDGEDYQTIGAPLRAWYEGGAAWTTYAAPDRVAALPVGLREALTEARQGIVVAGRMDHPAEGAAVRRLAMALGWPLFADIASHTRLGVPDAVRIDAFDLLLASSPAHTALRPDVVLYFGGRVTSKRLAQWLAAVRPPCFAVIRPDAVRFDPAHQVTHRIESDIPLFADRLTEEFGAQGATEPGWLPLWKDASDRLVRWLAERLPATGLSEPTVAHLLTRHVPAHHPLVLGSSMPVRDVDTFAAAGGAAARVLVNRGASGIDGTIATAAGAAIGTGTPVTLLLGDLACLHDLNALAFLREVPVVAVVVNNDGGGIFHFLPIANHEDVFEPFFGTPHGLGFEHAARLFELPYYRPETPAAFVEAYRQACASGRSALLEVVTDRHENAALHRRLVEEATAVLG